MKLFVRITVGITLTLIIVITTQANLNEFPLKEGPTLRWIPDCNEVDDCEETDVKICGTNGETFRSVCDFMRAHCKEANVKFKSFGECSASDRCHSKRLQALKDSEANKKGVFIPECNPDGTFMAVQCHKFTGFCWCSTAAGNVISNTQMKNEKPVCDNITDRASEDGKNHPRSPILPKGIASFPPEVLRKLLLLLNPELSAAVSANNSSLHDSLDSIIIEAIKNGFLINGEITHSTQTKKKQKRPRGCERQRRRTFNKNMLRNMIQEFKRNNKESAIPSSEAELRSVTLKWKFNELNRKKDKKLRRSEYKGIQNIIRRNFKVFKPRKCAKKFPKFCDLDADKSITLDEWIKCFTYEGNSNGRGKDKSLNGKPVLGKGKVTKTRPCSNDRKQALDSGSSNVYVPKCDAQGKYRPVQCYGTNATDSWYCFCVDVVTGDMIENTSIRYGTPNCSVSWPKCPPPDKEKKFLSALTLYFIKYAKEKIFRKQEPKAQMVNEENIAENIFKYFDKNGNNFIDGKEKRNLKKSIKKKDRSVWVCGRKIHVVCDSNDDGSISLQEFYNCISQRKGPQSANESFRKSLSKEEARRKKGKNPFIERLKGY